MTRKIFRSVSLTSVLAVVLATVLIAWYVYGVYESQLTSELRAEAGYIAHALSRETDETAFFDGFPSENRISLISPDGLVLYDSGADASGMGDHSDRPEVLSALSTGRGESRRYSDTLSETTFYYAVRTNGGNVLRVSNTRSSVFGMLLNMLPMLCGILFIVALASIPVARFAAKRIVRPINGLNLDTPLENDIYDELSPLLLRMEHQRREIDRQMYALREAREELAAITENMREGLMVLDNRGVLLSINASAAAVFGVHSSKHIGESILTVSRDPELHECVRSALEGNDADAIIEKNARYYQLLASPVTGSGAVSGAVLLALDITEKHCAELGRREFTANVSHELKTPLTSISGYSEIIRDGVARPEDVKAFAARINSEANRLMALISDILELSRLDERKGLGNKEPVELLSLAREAASQLESQASAKRISLNVSGEPAKIEGYPTLLSEMLFNIIDNAVKYTPEHGKVDVSVTSHDGCTEVCVADNGVGIPPEHHERIFERFYRVDKSHSRATGGTGLGLSIVKHGAAIHGAEIKLDSAPGRGTRMSLVFRA